MREVKKEGSRSGVTEERNREKRRGRKVSINDLFIFRVHGHWEYQDRVLP